MQRENNILKKKNALLQKKIKDMTLSKDEFLKCCDKYLTPQAALFLKEQILNEHQNIKGRRYSVKFKRFCLYLYFKGPKAYRALPSIFSLPCKATLSRLTSNISCITGLNDNIFNLLRIKVASMKESEKYCMICFDEMSLKCHLFYNVKGDEVVGFHDCGGKKKFQPAKLSSVFVARGIFTNWKQPLAYQFSNTACHSTELYRLLSQCILALQNIGLKVVIVVSDMGTNNKQLSNHLGITPQNPYFILNDQKIFFLFDVPHLLKATRNMFIKHNFKSDQCFLKMQYVRQFFEIDTTKKFKLAPKLTISHISPDPLEKMKTRRATQLFSQAVVTGINTYIHFEKIAAAAISTVTFIDKMDKLFDILNSTAQYKGDKLHAHIFVGSDLQLSFLTECFEFFDTLTVINSFGQTVTNEMKFIDGWKITISAVLKLWEYLKEKGFNSLETRRLNQDIIENLFGQIRAKGGNCLNPPPMAFVRTFKTLLFHNFFNTGSENCEDDFDKILLDLNRSNNHEHQHITVTTSDRGLFDDFTADDIEYKKLDLLEKNSIRYICGYLIGKCLKKHSCSLCESYSIHHVELEDSTISSFFRAYQNNTSFFGNLRMPHNNFIFYICYLEAIFNNNFERLILEKNVIRSFLAEAELVTFVHPCKDFPHLYVKKLFFRMRLYYTLKFINRSFKSCNPNKLIIWKYE